jgi:hypothetical protein
MTVAFDAKTSSSNGVDQFSGVTSTGNITSMTIGGSGTLLIVMACWDTKVTGRSCTWNSVSMTEQVLAASASGSRQTGIYTLVSPATGNKNLALSWTGSSQCYVSAISFTGTDTSTGVNAADNASANGTSVTSLSVNTSTSGATLVAACAFGGDGTPQNQTAIWHDNGLNASAGGSYALGGSGTNNHSFSSLTGTANAFAGVHILSSATAYTLSAATGTLLSTGTPAYVDDGIDTGAGTFSSSGGTITGTRGIKIDAEGYSYGLYGYDASLLKVGHNAYTLSTAQGIFALTGSTARFGNFGLYAPGLVPDLMGLNWYTACDVLVTNGLIPIGPVYSNIKNISGSIVTGQDAPPGTILPVRSLVLLTVNNPGYLLAFSYSPIARF